MLQELSWAEILCEHIGSVFVCWDIEKFDRSKLNLFLDIVMSYLYVFNALLGNRILRVKNGSTTVAIKWNEINWFAKFFE